MLHLKRKLGQSIIVTPKNGEPFEIVVRSVFPASQGRKPAVELSFGNNKEDVTIDRKEVWLRNQKERNQSQQNQNH